MWLVSEPDATPQGPTEMRSEMVPGAGFPDYELPDHTDSPCRLSELQGKTRWHDLPTTATM